ncbi:FKBP-type peptidyl-prolyl cis-trans isomerase [Jatrophihabitans fulvus]
MATNKQRREAERDRLRRQLEDRRRKEAARKRFVLVASVVGTLALIVVLVVVLATSLGGDDDTPAAQSPSATPTQPTSAAPSSPEAQHCPTTTGPGVVTFQGVSVGNAANIAKEPKVCSTSAKAPTKLLYKDLVVGKGKTPALTSTVSVQYTGVLYKNGTQFDSSWARGGQPAQFNLQQVVAGFTQGIGGNSAAKIPPMKVGGRRIVILPSDLGYGAQGSPPTIPANAPLVFVIDLKNVG